MAGQIALEQRNDVQGRDGSADLSSPVRRAGRRHRVEGAGRAREAQQVLRLEDGERTSAVGRSPRTFRSEQTEAQKSWCPSPKQGRPRATENSSSARTDLLSRLRRSTSSCRAARSPRTRPSSLYAPTLSLTPARLRPSRVRRPTAPTSSRAPSSPSLRPPRRRSRARARRRGTPHGAASRAWGRAGRARRCAGSTARGRGCPG